MVGGDRNENCYVPVPYPDGGCAVWSFEFDNQKVEIV